jgi:biotin carboxyl carrier protein
MKMENEIFAPVDGVVTIITATGSSVSTGDALAIIQ